MRKAFLVAAGISVMGAASAMAQGSNCGGQQTQAQDACQQAFDVFQFLSPQLGAVIAGGNAVMGTGSTLGGLGHFSIGARVNAVQGAYPQVDRYQQSLTGAKSSALQTKDSFLPFPTADAAIGIFGGLPLGVTNVGAVDALLSATYVPSADVDSIHVRPSQNWQIGYGARVGIIQESIVLPGVSVTWLKRNLPSTSITGTAVSGTSTSSLQVNNLEVNTTSWRIVASKSLVVLGFAAGFGKDSYDNKADIVAVVNNIPVIGTAQASTAGTQKIDRTNIFGDVSLNLPLFKIVGEAGRVSGGTVSTYNTFSGGRADRDLNYFSLGLRFGF